MKRVVVLFFLYLPISIYAQWLGSGATSGSGDMYYNGGYVGIGYSHPSYKLDVNGIFRAKDYIYLGRVGTDGRGIKADDGVGATIFSITRNPYNEIRFQGYGDLTFFTNGNTGTEKKKKKKTGNDFIQRLRFASQKLSEHCVTHETVFFTGPSKIFNSNLLRMLEHGVEIPWNFRTYQASSLICSPCPRL